MALAFPGVLYISSRLGQSKKRHTSGLPTLILRRTVTHALKSIGRSQMPICGGQPFLLLLRCLPLFRLEAAVSQVVCLLPAEPCLRGPHNLGP